MQTLTYFVPVPRISDHVSISTTNIPYIIIRFENASPPYDSVIIRNLETQEESRLVVINGLWKVQNYPIDHAVTFHNSTTDHRIIPVTPNDTDHQIVPAVLNDRDHIDIGSVGTRQEGGRVGRSYWNGFTVTRVLSPGKKVEVVFDDPVDIEADKKSTVTDRRTRILELRKDNIWRIRGETQKETKYNSSIWFGERKTGAEEGYF